jgi:DNA-binding response OmpR family regulator
VIAGSAVPRGQGKKRLLVIDDEPSICEFVRRVAEAEGFEVVTAVTHEQFKAAYESFRPSAILLDLMMPHVDGVALLENLAARHCTAQVMIMSGYHPELLNSSRRLGSNYALDVRGTLRKPFGVAELKDALHGLN